MEHLKIRPALPGDLPDLTKMIAALSAHHDEISPITPQTLSRDLFGSPAWAQVLVADQHGRLVGYAALLPRYRMHAGQRGLNLHHLFIREDFRGQGIGQRLIEASKDVARRAGCCKLTVGTDPKNETAQQIYEHLGFSRADASGPAFVFPLN